MTNLPDLHGVNWHSDIRQITVGERREDGVTHEQWVELCPLHRSRAA